LEVSVDVHRDEPMDDADSMLEVDVHRQILDETNTVDHDDFPDPVSSILKLLQLK
jgi:hypothetical protein